jgi:hypothetical protein
VTYGPVCVRAGHADARDVSGSTQTWTKTGTQMSHERTVCPFGLPRWEAFYPFFFIRRDTIQTAGGRTGSPRWRVNFSSLVVTA